MLEVVAAVVHREDGEFLLAERPEGKVYAGYWEFPGGKVEPGETPRDALARELHEELGIEVEEASPWLTRVYTYPHATVRLDFFRVTRWHGEPHGKENQRLSWQYPDAVAVTPLLPANGPILRALGLPPLYAVSNAAELGTAVFLERLDAALAGGLKLLQVREKGMAPGELAAFSAEVVRRAHAHGARVLVNGDVAVARASGADGVHLPARQLMALEARPEVAWCAASTHNAAELQRAAQLGVDFAVLSPVNPTLSHPGAPLLGWDGFAALAAGMPFPIYALGGMRCADLPAALQAGAHGIAMMREAWGVR
ncbi:MAG: Nudix family hydrolase [Sulfuricella sp.]|nr:Nudix family hydrolase [Sulfuricella sp.]